MVGERGPENLYALAPNINHQEEAMTTTTLFDLSRFARATEERDASTQVSMYGPAATVTIADPITQPGSPRVLQRHRGDQGLDRRRSRARHDAHDRSHGER